MAWRTPCDSKWPSLNELSRARKVNAALSRSQVSVGIFGVFGCSGPLLLFHDDRTSPERRMRCCNRRPVGGIVQPHPVQDKIMSIAEKRRAFRALHQSGCFVIPNPWNVGSARYMQGLGFKALATTSSGYAHSEGHPDGGPSAAQGA